MIKGYFVQTSNSAAFFSAFDDLGRRGAGEACLMVVDGVPGLGKTTTMNWAAVQAGWPMLRAKREWTPGWVLRELLETLGIPPAHSFERMFKQSIDGLLSRTTTAARDQSTFALVIDEADHICRRSEILETVRDISDLLEVPVVLVGMGRLRHALTRYPQVASRVARYVEFQTATLADVQALVAGLCEVPVADDLIAFLAKHADGKAREIKEGIAAIERHGLRNKGTVTLKAMVGQTLLNDRKSGQPILVRE
jgi:DNA transposition AAA+ family ATPase